MKDLLSAFSAKPDDADDPFHDGAGETSTPVVADVTDVLFRGAFLFFFFYWRLSNETSRKLAPFLIFYFIANGRS